MKDLARLRNKKKKGYLGVFIFGIFFSQQVYCETVISEAEISLSIFDLVLNRRISVHLKKLFLQYNNAIPSGNQPN